MRFLLPFQIQADHKIRNKLALVKALNRIALEQSICFVFDSKNNCQAECLLSLAKSPSLFEAFNGKRGDVDCKWLSSQMRRGG